MCKEFPMGTYRHSEQQPKKYFTLEWLLRMQDFKGNPVNRPAEILEGGWSESKPPPEPEMVLCHECGQYNGKHLQVCSKATPQVFEDDPMWDFSKPRPRRTA
jgi:hypothetical protein